MKTFLLVSLIVVLFLGVVSATTILVVDYFNKEAPKVINWVDVAAYDVNNKMRIPNIKVGLKSDGTLIWEQNKENVQPNITD